MINICIPHVVLKPVIPKLSVHYWMQEEKETRSPREMEGLKKKIMNAEVPVSVELGRTEITVKDFLMLDVGDVIQLDRNINDPLLVKVGNIPKFLGQPGNIKNWRFKF